MKRIKTKAAESGGAKATKEAGAAASATTTTTTTTSSGGGMSTWLRLALLLSFVPAFFSIPFVIQYTGEALKSYERYFYYLWAIYALTWVFFMFKKRNHTWESWFTYLLTWALFAMGSYALIGVFNFLDVQTKRVTLKLWASLTFIVYMVVIYIDEFDHVAHAAEEEAKAAKEQRREEKRRQRRREELAQQKKE